MRLLSRWARHSLVSMIMLVGSAANGQESSLPPGIPEEEVESAASAEQEETQERRRRASDVVRPLNVSPARVELAETTRLRGFTHSPPNVLLDLSRPDSLLRVGNFALQSRLAASASYDDNVDANQERDDQISVGLLGSLRAQSLFERHSLGAQVDVASTPIGRDDEELFDWAAGADGRLDLTSRSSLSAAVTGTRGTEDAASAEAAEVVDAAGEEATVTDIAGTVAYRQQFRRLGWQVSGGLGRFDAEASGDGGEADERDRTEYSIGAGADYDLSRRLALFGELDYDFADFDTVGEGGNRDSQSVGGDVGIAIKLGRSLAARLGVGYSTVFFEDPSRDDSNNLSAEIGLSGKIGLDRYTLLDLSLDHTTERTTVDDAALVTTTTGGGSITRSLTRRSAIQLSLEGTRSDFLDVDRTDYDITAQLAYSLAVTRSITFNSSYTFDQRFAEDAEDDYYRNLIALGVAFSF